MCIHACLLDAGAHRRRDTLGRTHAHACTHKISPPSIQVEEGCVPDKCVHVRVCDGMRVRACDVMHSALTVAPQEEEDRDDGAAASISLSSAPEAASVLSGRLCLLSLVCTQCKCHYRSCSVWWESVCGGRRGAGAGRKYMYARVAACSALAQEVGDLYACMRMHATHSHKRLLRLACYVFRPDAGDG